jgi:hypothetical protein
LQNDSLTVILDFAESAKSAAVVLPDSRIRQSSCRLHIFGNILPITCIRQFHQLGVTAGCDRRASLYGVMAFATTAVTPTTTIMYLAHFFLGFSHYLL